jgi:two-component system chemotaxis response regulator CheY
LRAVARVLVVDDSEPVRDLCGFVLSGRGHEVVYAADGAAALDLYASRRPDAVLLDVGLPGADGLAVLAELRRLDPEARVAMLTGARDQATVLDAVRSGARDYVVKPFLASRLVEAVDALLS